MKVVFFDGHCNLCNRFVDFLIRRDRRGVLKFASLQGATAQRLLLEELRRDVSTVVFLDGSSVHVRSSAALRALACLGGIYSLALALLVVPPFFRDIFYDLVARNRYRFWGRRSTCRIPSADERDRFLD